MIVGAAPAAPIRFADSPDGVLVAYRAYGLDLADASRPPVLLVHGFASTARITWEGTGWVRALEQAGRAVITVDLRGHGESDRPTDASAYAPERFGDDLAAVLDSARVDAVDAIGYSLGSRLVSALAQASPDRVRRVVVGGAGPTELFATWDIEEARAMLVRDEPPQNPVIAQVLGPALASGADRDALLACIEGLAGAPLRFSAELPTLFVAGASDPVPRGVEGLARERGSDLVIVPGRDHVSTLTSRVFKDAAIRFLGA